MPVEGRGPELGAVRKGGRDLTTDGSLRGSAGSVRKLQNALHAKAKEEPDRRFHALVDKVWRQDFFLEAWRMVRRNGGAAGVDGVTVADVEAYGVERWVGELSRDLRDGGYEPSPVRQVLIPKKQPGKFRPLGIPCLRDRVAQTSAMLVLGPIFEADLQPEQYAYRPGRSAKDAVQRIRGLLYRGHNEVVDADLSNYFGEIPHAELMKSIARRVSDGRMLGLIKAWLEMPVIEEDGKGGTRRTNRARKERKGTPQGAPISPLLSSIYMRRFILGWKVLGYARRFGAEIVNYADDFCVLGKASTAEMLAAVNRLMDRLKLPVNAEKTRCLRCPEEPLEFLGYRTSLPGCAHRGGRYPHVRPFQVAELRWLWEQCGLTCLARTTRVPSVGEGVIPTESRMREIRTSGSTGRGWKRTYGSRTWHRRESKAEEIHTVPLRAPRHLLTLPSRSHVTTGVRSPGWQVPSRPSLSGSRVAGHRGT